MSFKDEDERVQLNRIDPKCLSGFLSLASTLYNVAYSLLHDLYTFDALISASVIFGILSIIHTNSKIGKISLGILLCHLSIIWMIRLAI